MCSGHHGCAAVTHFAGIKAVGESVEKPLDYYDNNVVGYSVLDVVKAFESASDQRVPHRLSPATR